VGQDGSCYSSALMCQYMYTCACDNTCTHVHVFVCCHSSALMRQYITHAYVCLCCKGSSYHAYASDVSIYIHMYVYIHTHVYMHTQRILFSAPIRKYTYSCVLVYTYIHWRIHSNIGVFIRIFACTHIHAKITCVLANTHTYCVSESRWRYIGMILEGAGGITRQTVAS